MNERLLVVVLGFTLLEWIVSLLVFIVGSPILYYLYSYLSWVSL